MGGIAYAAAAVIGICVVSLIMLGVFRTARNAVDTIVEATGNGHDAEHYHKRNKQAVANYARDAVVWTIMKFAIFVFVGAIIIVAINR